MSTGRCGNHACQREFAVEVGRLQVTCPHCRANNYSHLAKDRYRNRDAPTPDPKMGTASPQTDPAQAFKTDAGKVQFDLLEDGAPNALLEIAKVMSWAVEEKGYHPHSWQEIPDAIRRYKAALGRHRNAIARGEVLDPESKLLHWAHAACCVIFITELELRSKQP